jgi:hypothetical protein
VTTCGCVTCPPGKVCCNDSCSQCTWPHEACTQLYCGDDRPGACEAKALGGHEAVHEAAAPEVSLSSLTSSFGRGPTPPPLGPDCPKDVPSVVYADALVGGDGSAAVPVLVWMGARAGLIALGVLAMGVRGPAVWKSAVGGTLAVEAYVLGFAAIERARRKRLEAR